MIEITNLEVFNIEGAIRGMRQPYKGINKSDSVPGSLCYDNKIRIGEKDLALAQRLVKAGSPHDKFMRQIFISMDISAPLYLWKELDTYKVGTVANSESTMHTITQTGFTTNNFSFDESFYNNNELVVQTGMTLLAQQIFLLNRLREYYLEEQDPIRKKKIWRTIIQALPESYMQKRTWTANYSIARALDKQRDGHKLSEWATIRERLKELPYAEELIFYKGK